MIRRAADELVCLVWFLEERLETGDFPRKLGVNSLDQAINFKHALFRRHKELLAKLNGVSNAYKHSFIQSQISLIGKDEPYVFAVELYWNDLAREPEFHDVPLDSLTRLFNAFLTDCLSHLQTLSERLR